MAITGGGTGGHVFPALAVVESIRSWADVVWIGSTTGVERRIVRRAGIPFVPVPSGKLRRYFSLRNAFDIFNVAAGFLRSAYSLRRLRPVVLFSKGGYVTVPPVAAARLLGIPVVSHESDVDPGLATRINARSSRAVAVSFPETAESLRTRPEYRGRVELTGNPIRQAIRSASAERGLAWAGFERSVPIVLVQGGSLGAREINTALDQILPDILAAATVIHQTGDHPHQPAIGGRYLPQPFFHDEFPDLLAAADVIVGRAGANSLWEAAALGKPSIVIPLGREGSRGDQIVNAASFAAHDAVVVLQSPVQSRELLDTILGLVHDGERRAQIGGAAGEIARVDAADRVAAIIRRVGGFPE